MDIVEWKAYEQGNRRSLLLILGDPVGEQGPWDTPPRVLSTGHLLRVEPQASNAMPRATVDNVLPGEEEAVLAAVREKLARF